MMKKRIYLLLVTAALAAVIAGCSKDPDKVPAPALSLSPAATAVVFSADGKTAASGGTALTPTFTVTTNQTAWDVQVTPAGSWCKAAKSGSAFTLTAEANPALTAPEPATVTVTAGNAQPVTISVTQFGADAALAISPEVETLEFSASGTKAFIGTQEVAPAFTVTTNLSSWDVNVTPADSWCRAAKTEDGTGFTLTADINRKTSAPGPVVVTVTAGEADPVTIAVTQREAVYDIYVAGMTQATGDNAVLSGWKNGQPLFTGTENPDKAFFPYQMAVSNGKVYTAGYINFNNGTYAAAVYENDREKYRLTNPVVSGDDGGATVIGVLNGDIYTAGWEAKGGSDADKFWKNGGSGPDGLTISMSPPRLWASFTDMAISGDRFLLCGAQSGNNSRATLFTSGPDLNFSAVSLAEAGVSTETYAVAVRGDEVLIAGYRRVESTKSRAVLWSVNAAGAVTESEPAGSVDGWFVDIAVEGEDVYLLLEYFDPNTRYFMTKVLRNGAEVEGCTMPATREKPRIAVAGGDIYWVAIGGNDPYTYDVYKNGTVAWRFGNALEIVMLEAVMRE
ncbi:BACON domain-containing protein [Phocaeicola sp.]